MDFTTSSTSGDGSYEKPKPGRYTGVLIGFADIGTQTGGQYGPKHKVRLRWELHKRKGPALGVNGTILTATAEYNATMNSKGSLRPVVEAHTGKMPDNQITSSSSWLGKAAIVVLEDDGQYVNVTAVTALDPEEDETPTRQCNLDHWEMNDDAPPPAWAKHRVEKSTEWQEKHGSSVVINGEKIAVAAGAGLPMPDPTDDAPPF
jgi:hypothetical protein